jgi:choline kinase
MNAIIIAGGSGQRISEEVKNTPKALIKVNGKSIIEYQISILKEANIENILVITGPNSEKFQLKNIDYLNDLEYQKHDILGTLMEAKKFFQNEVVVLYSDIIFDSKIFNQVLNSKGDISIAVDLNWEKAYRNRTDHPKSEAENVLLDESNKIIKIKKNIQELNNCIGEFLGIIKFSAKGSKIFIDKYNEVIKTCENKFQQAESIAKAYLTDMIQELIDSNVDIHPVFISGKWCEIDTMQDLKNAEKLFTN